MASSSPKGEFIATFVESSALTALVLVQLTHREQTSVGPDVNVRTQELKALPDPVKVSSAPSPVVVVVSLLFRGSVLTARRDTT